MNIVSTQGIVNFSTTMNSYPITNESIFSFNGNVNLTNEPTFDINGNNQNSVLSLDNSDSLLQNTDFYLQNSGESSFIDPNEESFLHTDQCDTLLKDPEWNEKDTMVLIELVGALGFNWIEVGKRLNKKAEDCHKRYDLVIKVFESKQRDPTNQSSSSSPIQSPSLNSSLPSPPEDFQSEDKAFDGSRRRKSTTMMDSNIKKRHRRTASEIDRSFKCYIPSCNKSYGTEGALKMHIKLKHPGAKIPNSYLTSPTLCGSQFYSPRMLTPYMSPHMLGMAGEIPKELVYNNSQQSNYIPLVGAPNNSYPQIPLYTKSPRAILPNNMSNSAPAIPTPVTLNPNTINHQQQLQTTSLPPQPQQQQQQQTQQQVQTTSLQQQQQQQHISQQQIANLMPQQQSIEQNNMQCQDLHNQLIDPQTSVANPTVAVQVNPSSSASSPSSPQVYKFSDLPAISLKIGTWEKVSSFCGDLVARFSYTERKFMWEVFNIGLSLRKMEIFFDDISQMELAQLPDGRIEINFTVKRSPLFFEAKFEPNTTMIYKPCPDFTGGQASTVKKHTLCFIQNALANPLEALGTTDPKFKVFIEASKINFVDLSKSQPLQQPMQQQLYFSQSAPVPYLELEPNTINNNIQNATTSLVDSNSSTISSNGLDCSQLIKDSQLSSPTYNQQSLLQQQQQQQQNIQQQNIQHSIQQQTIQQQVLQQQSIQHSIPPQPSIPIYYKQPIPQHTLYTPTLSSASDLLPEIPPNEPLNMNYSGNDVPHQQQQQQQQQQQPAPPPPIPMYSSTSDLNKCFNDIALCSPVITGMSNNPSSNQNINNHEL